MDNLVKNILPLEEQEVRKVAAASFFPNFVRIVEELVLNSIEAHASTISVEIDFDRFDLKIEDDGN
jgi:DNA mismatch repair ATPase MutL